MARSDHPTSIRLTRESRAALLKEAQERRWSMTMLVQYILDEWIKWRKRQEKAK